LKIYSIRGIPATLYQETWMKKAAITEISCDRTSDMSHVHKAGREKICSFN